MDKKTIRQTNKKRQKDGQIQNLIKEDETTSKNYKMGQKLKQVFVILKKKNM